MSLNFNGPGDVPIIREAQNMMNNGGGGNLGYFQGRKKKKEKEINLFNTEEEDTFSLSSDTSLKEEEVINAENSSIKDKIKEFLEKFKK